MSFKTLKDTTTKSPPKHKNNRWKYGTYVSFVYYF